MIITKIIKQTKDGYLVSCKDGKTSMTLHGNIPKLYGGMLVDFEVSDKKILSYQYIYCQRNDNILNKHLDEIESLDKFYQKIAFHKELEDILWKDLDKTYNRLPFEKADRIALHKGKKPTDKERIKTIHNMILNDMRSSDKSFTDIGKYISAFRNIEGKGAFNPLSIVEIMEVLSTEKIFGLNKNGLYDKDLVEAENYIRATMSSRAKNTLPLVSISVIEDYLNDRESNEEIVLSSDQREAVWSLKDRKPDFITGGAGTGKTTVIKAIIDCYAREYGLGALCLLAPTGKASERMTEVIGIQAHTIHSALRKTPDSEFVFYNQDNPLPYALIIVDESSMVDSLLMADLLHATQEDTKLLFVGDCNQLPPVSCGHPFHDFLSSGRFFELKVNHRQGEGNIVLKNAYHILNDELMEESDDFIIKEICGKDISKYCDKDIQILSPYNAINDIINQALRVDKTGVYAVGDKVIALRNTKDYCNGDIFTIEDTKHGYCLVSDGKSKRRIIIKDLDDFMLSYAITIHKMQGSECDEIILFLPKTSQFVTKNMLYTAVTRAKKRVRLYYYD